MKRFIGFGLVLLMLMLNLSPLVKAAEQVKPVNVPIFVRLKDTVDCTQLQVGDELNFYVVNDVVVNNKVIIPKKTPVVAVVKSFSRPGKMGRPGNVTLGYFVVFPENGKRIPLTGEVTEKAESRMARSIALSAAIIPFFLFMKGKDVELPKGYQTGLILEQTK